MQCEVCGRRIAGKPFNVIIEGAKMAACPVCAKLGSIDWGATPTTQPNVKRNVSSPSKRAREKRRQPLLVQNLELVEDFNLRVRQAREKLGLSHEDLGKRIGEKVSVLRKIESGRMLPDDKIANKLEHALKTKLLVPFSEPKQPKIDLSLPREATLGFVARIKGKKMEEKKERESS